MKRIFLLNTLLINICYFSALTNISYSKEKVAIKKAPCRFEFDYLTGEKFKVCLYDNYYPERMDNIKTGYYNLIPWLTNTNYKFSKRYEFFENGSKKYFEVNVPVDPENSKRGVYSPISGVNFATSTTTTVKKSIGNVTGNISEIRLSNTITAGIGSILSSSLTLSGMSQYYSEHATTYTYEYTFNNSFVEDYLYEFRPELKNTYSPIRIDEIKLCSSSSKCKGKQGSYISDSYYILVPMDELSIVRCFRLPNDYYYDYKGNITPLADHAPINYYRVTSPLESI